MGMLLSGTRGFLPMDEAATICCARLLLPPIPPDLAPWEAAAGHREQSQPHVYPSHCTSNDSPGLDAPALGCEGGTSWLASMASSVGSGMGLALSDGRLAGRFARTATMELKVD